MSTRSHSLLGLLVVLGVASVASAQEIALTGPLKSAPGRAHYYWRRGRWVLAPSTGIAFESHEHASLLFGGEGLFHPAEWLGLGIHSHLSVPFEPTQTLRHLVLAPEAVLIPYAHKAGLFHSIYFPYDIHLEVGPARVWSWGQPGSRREWAALAGGGLSAFSASFFSTSLDYRAVIGNSIEHLIELSFGFWPQAQESNE